MLLVCDVKTLVTNVVEFNSRLIFIMLIKSGIILNVSLSWAFGRSFQGKILRNGILNKIKKVSLPLSHLSLYETETYWAMVLQKIYTSIVYGCWG